MEIDLEKLKERIDFLIANTLQYGTEEEKIEDLKTIQTNIIGLCDTFKLIMDKEADELKKPVDEIIEKLEKKS